MNESWERIYAWLLAPHPGLQGEIAQALVALGAEGLGADACRTQIIESTPYAVKQFEREVCEAAECSSLAVQNIVISTAQYWREQQRTGSELNRDILREKVATQLAAVLAFQCLPLAKKSGSAVWIVVVHRLAEKILLPYAQTKFHPRLDFLGWESHEAHEDHISTCEMVLLECQSSTGAYTNQELRRDIRNAAYEVWKRIKPELRAQDISLDELEDYPQPESPGSTAQEARQKMWEFVLAVQKQNFQAAIIIWLILSLEIHQSANLKQIEALLQQPSLGLLDLEDLPPGVGLEQAREALPKKPGLEGLLVVSLTYENIRQRKTRYAANCRRWKEDHPDADA